MPGLYFDSLVWKTTFNLVTSFNLPSILARLELLQGDESTDLSIWEAVVARQ